MDKNVEKLKDSDLRWADYVMLGAMIVHKDSVREIVARCAAFGKTVIAGGPLFTTGHEAFPEIQHFVLGEAEEIMPQVVADMQAGRLQSIYQASHRPDITRTPAPRWDLIKFRHYVTMSVQFSRGCPFDCEFCDIIVMNGRVPRTKTPEQLIAELDALRQRGWKNMVFIVDDNFIGNKARTKTLLHALIEWRKRTRTPIGFLTEASMNLADDPELCALMVEAGFKKVFVGIETPSVEALGECHKIQNQNRDLVASVKTLQRAGLEVMGGFIVGFDSDKSDIFKRQFEFIQRSGVATAMVGLLTALPQTRLWQRLKTEGRLEAESSGNNSDATLNFKPKLNREFLQSGYRDLVKKLQPAHPHISKKPSSIRPAPAVVAGRFHRISEIVLGAGSVASRADGLLAAVLGHASPATAPVPASHRTRHPRLPFPPRGQDSLRRLLSGED